MRQFGIKLMFFLFIMDVAWKSHTKKTISRITGGQDASSDYYTNIVRVELSTSSKTLVKFVHICTASVLTSTWVLTAAHCIADYEEIERDPDIVGLKLLIRYGSDSIPWINDSFSVVIDTIKHPSYRQSDLLGRLWLKNDVGLLKTEPIKIDSYRKLSALDYSSLVGHKTVAAGYGITNDGPFIGDTLILTKSLQVMDVLVRKCSGEHQTIYPAMCLSRRCGVSSAICPGDSGGPLLHSSGVVGVISMGDVTECFEIDSKNNNWFAIVTPVSPFVEWISKHIHNRTFG